MKPGKWPSHNSSFLKTRKNFLLKVLRLQDNWAIRLFRFIAHLRLQQKQRSCLYFNSVPSVVESSTDCFQIFQKPVWLVSYSAFFSSSLAMEADIHPLHTHTHTPRLCGPRITSHYTELHQTILCLWGRINKSINPRNLPHSLTLKKSL